MIYMRGQARDYDAWAAATGDAGWRWDAVPAVLPAPRGPLARRRRAARRRRRVARRAPAPVAGRSWTPSPPRRGEAGIPATEDFNRGDNEGVGYFEVNQRRGVRWNARKAFLRPVRAAGRTWRCWTGAHGRRGCCSSGEARRCAPPASSAGRRRGSRCAVRGGARGRAGRRRDRHAAAAAAVGHRRRPRCCSAHGIDAAARAARRRREPAGPPADPRRVRGRRRAAR